MMIFTYQKKVTVVVAKIGRICEDDHQNNNDDDMMGWMTPVFV